MNRVWNKKIPTFFALIVLVIGIGATTLLVQKTTNLFGHAAPSETPEDIRFTNITDSSFTVTYKTESQIIGTLQFGAKDSGQEVLDDRDQKTGVPKSYFLHSITVNNLKPETTYSFSVLSGQTTFTNGDAPFAVKTGPKLDQDPSEQIPLSGRAVNADGTKPDEAIIYVTAAGAQTLSTLIKPSGLYILPLNLLRTSDLSKLTALTQDTPLQILIISPTATSQAVILPTSINPVPVITLSQNYDFTLSSTPIAAADTTNLKFPTFALDTSIKATPQILVPKSDESFSDQQPTFDGTALPNGDVSVTIHSADLINAQVKADASGKWTYRPDKPLSPGKHTITITTADKFGILHTIEQSFTVYAAGSQVNESATPSGQLATPTPTPVRKNTPTPTPKPAAKPTATPTPTPIPTTKGGLSLVTPTLSPKPSLPPTGSNTVTLTALAGITTTIVGIALFVMTRGASL